MNYYKHIDELPLHNWIKINEGELVYCRKDIEKGTKEQDQVHYELISDSNYKEFGVSKHHLRLLNLQHRLAIERLDWIITGIDFKKNKIKRLEFQIEELLKMMEQEGSGDIGEIIISISKWVGYRVDPKVITVKEFRSMISLYKKEAKSQKS